MASQHHSGSGAPDTPGNAYHKCICRNGLVTHSWTVPPSMQLAQSFAEPHTVPELAIQPVPAANSRPLILAAYPVALLLFAATLFDEGPKVWPLHPDDRSWRYGAAGIALNAVITPLLALGIAFAAAFLARHRLVVRVLAALSLAAGIALVGAVVLFLVDYSVLATDIDPRVAPGFRVATWKTVGTMLIAIPAVFWFGVGGWRAARDGGAPAGREGSGKRSSNLVVGQ